METVLISAKAILALLDADHPKHIKALAALEDMKNRGTVPLLTNLILAETFSLLSSVMGRDAGRTWLRHNIWQVERVNEGDEARAREMLLGTENGGSGLEEISYVEATTRAVMERLKVDKVLEF